MTGDGTRSGDGTPTPLVITGAGAVGASGIGLAPLHRHLATGGCAADLAAPVAGIGTASTGTVTVPVETAPVLAGFDVRERLGRKGTSFYDRATALAVVACGEALREGGVRVDDDNRHRIGIVLGTTLGSFRSTSDYSRDTLVQDKPYHVNPVLFPNTVMNCAAGQAAIRLRLRGVNATIAGGPLGMHQALRYASNAIERGYADVMLVGAVEEYSPHRAWATRLGPAGDRGAVAGEGAVVVVLARPHADAVDGAAERGRLLAVTTGFGADPAVALAGCVRRALRRGGVPPERVELVVTGSATGDPAEADEYEAAVAALGHRPPHWHVPAAFGACDSATGALGVGALLAGAADATDSDAATPRLAVLTARSRDGAVAAAVIRSGG